MPNKILVKFLESFKYKLRSLRRIETSFWSILDRLEIRADGLRGQHQRRPVRRRRGRGPASHRQERGQFDSIQLLFNSIGKLTELLLCMGPAMGLASSRSA